MARLLNVISFVEVESFSKTETESLYTHSPLIITLSTRLWPNE